MNSSKLEIETTMQITQAYSQLRRMSGGKLSQSQVKAGDEIIEKIGFEAFAQLIGYPFLTKEYLKISEKGYELIRSFEGFRTLAYQDTGGVATIGFGTIKYPNGTSVQMGDYCTREQAEQWLKHDCSWVQTCLNKQITIALTQNQIDALASFVYNIGETAFVKSTLLKLINQKKIIDAGNQFDRWVFDNGKRIQGLVNRRLAEKKLFMTL